ncbi:MAG: dipeptidase [Thermomicrobiales bacterium]|nr:dipeptidase [Thermomicrobiales bacterium]MCO5222959.1 dipeptidase [Thermomicrobiales bacterium]
MSIDAARGYSREKGEAFIEQLTEFLRIPSLSGTPERAGDVAAAADWLAENMRGAGVAQVAVMPTAGHPVVYGEWLGAGPDKPTVLVYGHYDVVPASKEDGWDTEPFEPVISDGKIWARGATDDKGQLLTHVKALESYLKSGNEPPVNVKFLMEGEEEVSSPNLRPFIEEHLDLLAADVCIISDSSMRTIDEPAITYSLRGMTYIEVTVEGPHDDLHSGFYGGTVHNPALALVQLLSKMFDDQNRIAVPGFYDDVVAISDRERAEIAKSELSERDILDATGVPAVWGEADVTIRERVSARPTLEINGITSGWGGPGPKTIIPANAKAKISSRLVANQDPHRIYDQLKDFFESNAPETVKVTVELLTTGEPALVSFELPEMQAAKRAYEIGWGATPIFVRGGGSIPIVADILHLLDMPVVMMGFGLDTDGLHGTNEHFSLEMFQRGIETSIVFLDEIARL